MLSSSFSAIAFLATAVVAQSNLGAIPQCAASCVGNSLQSGTGCATIDIGCICKSSGWISGLSCCVSKACSQADQDATIKYASGLCAAYATLPTAAVCPSASANGTAPATVSAASNSSSAATAKASSASYSSVATTSAAKTSSAATTSGSAAAAKAAGNGREQVGMGLGLAAAGLLAAVL